VLISGRTFVRETENKASQPVQTGENLSRLSAFNDQGLMVKGQQ